MSRRHWAKSVRFSKELVSSISRAPHVWEYCAIVTYHDHVTSCNRCTDSVLLLSAPNNLCRHGRLLAAEVEHVLYSSLDGKIYSTTDNYTRFTRVEIPRSCYEASRLLQIIRRRHSQQISAPSSASERRDGWYNLVVRTRRVYRS